jgi:hypothetical protein
MLSHLLNNRPPEAMTYQNDVLQLALLNVSCDAIDAVGMCNFHTRRTRTMTGKRRRICNATLLRKMVNDILPRPSAMPRPVNENKCLPHGHVVIPCDLDSCPSIHLHIPLASF